MENILSDQSIQKDVRESLINRIRERNKRYRKADFSKHSNREILELLSEVTGDEFLKRTLAIR